MSLGKKMYDTGIKQMMNVFSKHDVELTKT